jgi:predicted RNA methylase
MRLNVTISSRAFVQRFQSLAGFPPQPEGLGQYQTDHSMIGHVMTLVDPSLAGFPPQPEGLGQYQTDHSMIGHVMTLVDPNIAGFPPQPEGLR